MAIHCRAVKNSLRGTGWFDQRVLDDLWRTKLSRHGYDLASSTPSPSHVSKFSLFLSLPVELTSGGGGSGREGEEPNHTTTKSLVRYKSFNIL
jgi:hypothetical protein